MHTHSICICICIVHTNTDSPVHSLSSCVWSRQVHTLFVPFVLFLCSRSAFRDYRRVSHSGFGSTSTFARRRRRARSSVRRRPLVQSLRPTANLVRTEKLTGLTRGELSDPSVVSSNVSRALACLVRNSRHTRRQPTLATRPRCSSPPHPRRPLPLRATRSPRSRSCNSSTLPCSNRCNSKRCSSSSSSHTCSRQPSRTLQQQHRPPPLRVRSRRSPR